MKLYLVTLFGDVIFYTNDILAAEAYSNNTAHSKVVTGKMNNKLYKVAYKFLKLRSQTKYCFDPIDKLNQIERLIVSKFLEYKHQVSIF